MKNSPILNYLKPSYYMEISKKISLILLIVGSSIIISSLLVAFFYTEVDLQQGENYRIIYIHVPAAWISLLIYSVITIFSVLYLITLIPICFWISKSLAQIGIIFTFITLTTGSFWGLPIWGTWWVWDARLTSVLILFLIYLLYLVFIYAFENTEQAAKSSSILAIIGFINIPIIKYSVEWWNTLHQTSSISQIKSTIENSMMFPLILIFLSFLLLTSYYLILDFRFIYLHKRLKNLKEQKD